MPCLKDKRQYHPNGQPETQDGHALADTLSQSVTRPVTHSCTLVSFFSHRTKETPSLHTRQKQKQKT
jgi:hypothetical protein